MDRGQGISNVKKLILTEKPSVARDFAKALGVKGNKDGYIENEEYIITWAVGHLVELLEPDEYDPRWKSWRLDTLPIIPHAFQYKPIARTEKQLNIVRSLLSRPLETVVIATDAGREGEVIARTILMHAGFSDDARLKRFWTSQALTPQVVNEGMKSLKPASAYDRLWRAGQSRQIADWLVGMSCTRAATLFSRISSGKSDHDLFSVGRVQTAVLSLLVDRRRERENFKPEPYWLLRSLFRNEKGEWHGLWFKKDQTRFTREEAALEILARVKGQTGTVLSLKKNKKKEPPPPLYSLTELQRDANKKFGFSAIDTLGIAQDLYESKKCLSYPRTDSTVLGTKNVEMVEKLVNNLSNDYPALFQGVRHDLIRTSNKRVFNDAKLTDHHALIPLAPLPRHASDPEKKIYDLVLKRFAAAFHSDCEFEQTEIVTDVVKETFRTRGKVILNPGWRLVYGDEKPGDRKKDDEEEAENLPPLEKGDRAEVREAGLDKKMTQAPPEYTEAILLKDMTNPGRYVSEDALKKIYRGDVGLGTQATRAQIIETLLTRKYLVRKKKQLIATDKGVFLVESLRRFKTASLLTSPEETARWETQLEQIAQGEGSDAEFLKEIKTLVTEIVDAFKTGAGTQVLGPCPACGGNVTEGKKGYGCANWRDQDGGCKFVIWKTIAGKPISPEMARELIEKGRIGPIEGFMSKKGTLFSTSLQLVEEEGKWSVRFDFSTPPPAGQTPGYLGKCPVCGGNIIEGKKGFGCDRWREKDGGCRFVIWKNIAGREISPVSVIQLVEKGGTDILFGFVSKSGNAFSARLKLQDDGSGIPKVVFDFPEER